MFNAANDRTQLKGKISSTNDFKTDFTFDALGRMTDIVQQSNSGNTVASKHVTLAYNKLHQFTALNRYESTGTSNQVASTDYGYDSLHRLTDLDHKQGGTTLNSYDYAYDFASRMTSVTSTADGATSFTNDKTNQLTGADFTGQTDETYTFDDNGNRIGGSYTVGANNLTSTDGTYNYTYDDEGNRTRRTKISDSSYEEYTWDYRNRLTAVTFKNSGGTTLKTVAYEYDALNRLIRRTYDADGPGGGAAVDQFWAFDEGINPLLEFDANTSADVSHRYLWGPQVDQLLADEQVTSTGSAGNVLWALGDNLGTIRDIADLSGSTTTVTNHRRFGAYGNVVSESNAAVDLIFAFTGKLFDEVTELQNNLNRWYDPKLGQFASPDPIGFAAGDANVRRYVGNDVLEDTDSTGLINGRSPSTVRSRWWWWSVEPGIPVGGAGNRRGPRFRAGDGDARERLDSIEDNQQRRRQNRRENVENEDDWDEDERLPKDTGLESTRKSFENARLRKYLFFEMPSTPIYSPGIITTPGLGTSPGVSPIYVPPVYQVVPPNAVPALVFPLIIL